MYRSRTLGALAIVLAAGVAADTLLARQAPTAGAIPAALFGAMKWRPVGPLRGGRTCAVDGHRRHPFTFYIGVCNGGVWKTTDAGVTWTPIFDDQPTQSIGAIAISACWMPCGRPFVSWRQVAPPSVDLKMPPFVPRHAAFSHGP